MCVLVWHWSYHSLLAGSSWQWVFVESMCASVCAYSLQCALRLSSFSFRSQVSLFRLRHGELLGLICACMCVCYKKKKKFNNFHCWVHLSAAWLFFVVVVVLLVIVVALLRLANIHFNLGYLTPRCTNDWSQFQFNGVHSHNTVQVAVYAAGIVFCFFNENTQNAYTRTHIQVHYTDSYTIYSNWLDWLTDWLIDQSVGRKKVKCCEGKVCKLLKRATA